MKGRIVKRILDLFLSISLILGLSWVFLAIALLHRLYSMPLVFRQRRVGYMGRLFTLYKFTTIDRVFLIQETVSELESATASGDGTERRLTERESPDPIIVSVPLVPNRYFAFLRKYRIDELPQLINILKGDMSFVGPRPLLEEEIREYGLIDEDVDLRHYQKPGITGLSQICVNEAAGKTASLIKEKINHDIWYCRKRNIALDIRILALTPLFIVTQREITRLRKIAGEMPQ